MKNEKKTGEKNDQVNTGKSHGPQGVDKAPAEEVSEDNVDIRQQTQKGKKVDADPSKESDKPTRG